MLKKIFKDRQLIVVLLFALIVRLFFMWIYPDQNFPDAVAYKTIGQEIFSGQIITNNTYMPLYPIWSYLTGGGSIQILMDIFISVASVWLVFTLSLLLFENRFSALLSAAISTLYPHFLFYSVSGLTEVFYTFLLLFSFFSVDLAFDPALAFELDLVIGLTLPLGIFWLIPCF